LTEDIQDKPDATIEELSTMYNIKDTDKEIDVSDNFEDTTQHIDNNIQEQSPDSEFDIVEEIEW
jgi:hypothetical protein